MSSDRKLELVEPTFVLRASDSSAPSLIRQWARRRELAIKKGYLYLPDGPGEVARARQVAMDMETWAQRDAVAKYREVMATFSKRFPGGQRSAEVIKLPRKK